MEFDGQTATQVRPELGGLGAPGPEVEGLVGTAALAVVRHEAEERVGHPVDRDGTGQPVDERGVGTERAAEADVDGLLDVLGDVCDVAPEADVRDLRLSAPGGTTREVHPDDPGVRCGGVRAVARAFFLR